MEDAKDDIRVCPACGTQTARHKRNSQNKGIVFNLPMDNGKITDESYLDPGIYLKGYICSDCGYCSFYYVPGHRKQKARG